MVRTKITDGGRARSGYALERRDCTVRALALAASIPYSVAHDIAQHAGRKMKRGWYTDKILPQANKDIGLDFRIRQIEKSDAHPLTLNQVVKLIPKGRFIIETVSHAIALIDGIFYDRGPAPAKARVQSVYEIIPREVA